MANGHSTTTAVHRGKLTYTAGVVAPVCKNCRDVWQRYCKKAAHRAANVAKSGTRGAAQAARVEALMQLGATAEKRSRGYRGSPRLSAAATARVCAVKALLAGTSAYGNELRAWISKKSNTSTDALVLPVTPSRRCGPTTTDDAASAVEHKSSGSEAKKTRHQPVRKSAKRARVHFEEVSSDFEEDEEDEKEARTPVVKQEIRKRQRLTAKLSSTARKSPIATSVTGINSCELPAAVPTAEDKFDNWWSGVVAQPMNNAEWAETLTPWMPLGGVGSSGLLSYTGSAPISPVTTASAPVMPQSLHAAPAQPQALPCTSDSSTSDEAFNQALDALLESWEEQPELMNWVPPVVPVIGTPSA